MNAIFRHADARNAAHRIWIGLAGAIASTMLTGPWLPAAHAEKPQRGGELVFPSAAISAP